MTPPAPIASCTAPQHQLEVLVVDDHSPTRDVLRRLLVRRGMSVRVAACMQEAVALAAGATFDLLISDVGLPDGDGCELMAFLRERYHLKGIAMTGHGMQERVFRGQKAGFSAYLIKPITINALDDAIAVAMQP